KLVTGVQTCALPIFIFAIALLGSAVLAQRASGAIVVGSKNFTEQVILGELLAQTIERDTGLAVDRRLNLGGTLICDRALLTGDKIGRASCRERVESA